MPSFVLCLLQSNEEILAFKVLTLATTLWKFSYNDCYLIKNLSGENEFVALIRFFCGHSYLTMLNSFSVADDDRSFGRARWTFWFVYSELNNSDKIRNANVKPALSGIYAWCRQHQQLTAQSANEVIEIVWGITGWPSNILSYRQEEESELWTSLLASASRRGIPSKSLPHKEILI